MKSQLSITQTTKTTTTNHNKPQPLCRLPQQAAGHEVAHQLVVTHAGTVGLEHASVLGVSAAAQPGGRYALALHVFYEIRRVDLSATLATGGF